MASVVDQVYRSFIMSKFFSRGWGNPEQLKKLFEFRRNIANREGCIKLVDPKHQIVIDKVLLDESGECKLIDGHFRSPFADHLPGLLPEVAETAYFQMVVPADEKDWKGQDRPICIQMAGTGDHFFWRRRNFIAKPLLKDHGIASLILENPFYGLRKPQEQFRSSLLNVSDIFVMGGSLILEGMALLNFCEREGYGPCVMHGISMGGHMASLAAINWPKPVALVPCLSWSTAAGVFTQGVLSGAIDWKKLETQFFSNNVFKDELFNMVLSNNDEAYLAGKDFVTQYKETVTKDDSANPVITSQDRNKWFQSLTDFLKERGLIKILPELNTVTTRPSNGEGETETQKGGSEYKILEFRNMFMGKGKSKVQKEAIQFMRGVMDEFTHFKNFSKPVDPSMIIIVAAKEDAYVPRSGYQPMDKIWPECEVRFIDGGHITSYLLHQRLFKKTIAEAVDRYRAKYNPDGTLKISHQNSTDLSAEEAESMRVTTTDHNSEVLDDVIRFSKSENSREPSPRM